MTARPDRIPQAVSRRRRALLGGSTVMLLALGSAAVPAHATPAQAAPGETREVVSDWSCDTRAHRVTDFIIEIGTEQTFEIPRFGETGLPGTFSSVEITQSAELKTSGEVTFNHMRETRVKLQNDYEIWMNLPLNPVTEFPEMDLTKNLYAQASIIAYEASSQVGGGVTVQLPERFMTASDSRTSTDASVWDGDGSYDLVMQTMTSINWSGGGGNIVSGVETTAAAEVCYRYTYTVPVDPPAPVVSLGDRVWWDTDRDGQQDVGEPGAAGVAVRLYAASGTEVVATAVTDANGFYAFTGLTPSADYRVQFIAPADARFTVSQSGPDTSDSDPDTEGMVRVTAPASGENSGEPELGDDPTIDAGLVQLNLTLEKQRVSTGKVYRGSTVDFELTPANTGRSDALAGWSVTDLLPEGMTLVSMAGEGYVCVPSAATCTAELPLAAGAEGPPITVTARVDAPLSGELINVAFVAPSEEEIPETNPLERPARHTADTDPTDTAASATDNDAAAPIVTDSLVSVGDRVWNDVDRDGRQDADEPAVAGVTVRLYAADGESLSATAVTDEQGFYSFTDLIPGAAYVVEFVTPSGFSFTAMNAGADDSEDSDAAPATGRVGFIAPAIGSNGASDPDDPTIEAGLVAFNLTVAKSLLSAGPVTAGDTVEFGLIAHNDGPSDALAGWSVTDLLPAGLTLDSVSGTGYTCDVATATCVSESALAAGASGAVITVTATVDPAFSGELVNLAYVSPSPSDVDEVNPLAVPAAGTDTQDSSTDNDAEARFAVSRAATPSSSADPGEPSAPALASTGGGPVPGLIGAAAALMIAGGLVVAALRRRSQETRRDA